MTFPENTESPNSQPGRRRILRRSLICVTAAALTCGGLAIAGTNGFAMAGGPIPSPSDPAPSSSAPPSTTPAPDTPEYVYAWAGVEGRDAADRIVTLDYTPSSPTYGQVVSQTPIPDPGSEGNEPHHCGISMDAQTLVCGGLLSALRDQNSVFVFSLKDPANPVFVKSFKTANADFPDDFVAMPDGTFLFTQMGSSTGGDGGRIAKIDNNGNLLGQWPDNPPEGFNPHGIQVREDANLMVTCDYLQPNTTLTSYDGPIAFRSSVRVWDLSTMQITKTIELPSDAQTMDCRLIPNDPQGRGYVGGSGNGILYLFNSTTGTAQPVIDMNAALGGPVHTQYASMAADGRHLYVPYLSDSGDYDGVAVLDITNREAPTLVQDNRFPHGAGPHMSMLINDGTKLLVTDYFLNEDDFGKIHYEGDHYVRSFSVDAKTGALTADPGFQVDLNTAVPGVLLRPHGAEVSWPMDGMTMPSAPALPVAQASIAGGTTVGDTLSIGTRVWPAPETTAYRWLRDNAVIDGATGSTYTLTSDDVGHNISAQATFSRTGYKDTTKTTNVIVPEAAQGSLTFTNVTATITNETRPGVQGAGVGDTVDANYTASPQPDSVSYLWLNNGLPGNTSDRDGVFDAVGGYNITLQVTVHKDGYRDATVTSAPMAAGGSSQVRDFTAEISGTGTVGSTLTAQAPTVDDGSILAYQWLRDGVPITGAVSPTYTVTGSDAGHSLTVQISNWLEGDAISTETSAPLPVLTSAQPFDLALPWITQSPTNANQLVANFSVTPTADAVSYQWLRDGTPIPGATGADYTVASADYGHYVCVQVTFSKVGYLTTPVTGLPAYVRINGTVATAPANYNYSNASASITGNAVVGGTLSVVLDVTPTPTTVTYQWNRDGWPITGATNSTYVVQPSDAGSRIDVMLSLSGPGPMSAGTSTDQIQIAAATPPSSPSSTPSQAPSSPAASTPPPSSSTPSRAPSSSTSARSFSRVGVTVSGGNTVGQTLAASATSSPSASSWTYQWMRDGKPIAGATSRTYTLTSADAGHSISVTVTAVRSGYTSKAAASSTVSVRAAQVPLWPWGIPGWYR